MSELDRDLDRNAEATNRLRDVVGRLGQKDLERSLGGGWTVGFALVHLRSGMPANTWRCRDLHVVRDFHPRMW